MTVKRTIDHTPVPVHIWTEDVTPEAVQQLEHVARLPFVHSHVAAMPDVHVGVGSTIGSVIPTRDRSGRGGGGHRLRDDRGPALARCERAAGLARRGAIGDRGAGAGRLPHA